MLDALESKSFKGVTPPAELRNVLTQLRTLRASDTQPQYEGDQRTRSRGTGAAATTARHHHADALPARPTTARPRPRHRYYQVKVGSPASARREGIRAGRAGRIRGCGRA